jgi:transposase
MTKSNQSIASVKVEKSKPKNSLGYIDSTVAEIDIGSELIQVSVLDGAKGVIIKEFGTTTLELKDIIKFLKTQKVETGVMEATGVCWVLLYEMMEEAGLKAVLVDVKSIKSLPGRKTDVQDCQWIMSLYSSGMVRAAYQPPRNLVLC